MVQGDGVRAGVEPKTTILAIVGPTAAGKTAVGTRVALRIGAEVVSVDSMQVYRGMDIGTSKPGREERLLVPHHLLDVADPGEDFSVAVFKDLADGAIADIVSRGMKPLLVGGSGLYFRAVVDDLDFAGAPGDRGYREAMDAATANISSARLHELLRGFDPDAAAAIEPSNRRRILRALEVSRFGDRLISESQLSWAEYRSPYRLVAVGLDMERALLYRLIDERVDRMIADGLEEEVRKLLGSGLSRGTTAAEALGYRQMIDFIEGDLEREEAVALIKKKTKDFARRQLTWFRKDPRIRWFSVGGGPSTTLAEFEGSLEKTAAIVFEYMAGELES